ncbi:hypothetical protein PEDI_42850 [Persicobacter diffluens]|uniref:Uncharacterized protein n=1 Tax=Persicobacter diffluens TaxID=981 RepID=A0AAN5APD9_9BACT|nr:hypothetical protein PEDI_42850 [Persicobacter diffluens]
MPFDGALIEEVSIERSFNGIPTLGVTTELLSTTSLLDEVYF